MTPSQLEKVYDVLLKHYGPLKDQFYTNIALSDYPTIQWMHFGTMCNDVS